MKLVFFDTETTGIKPGSICQLSYITVDNSVKPAKTEGKNIFFTVEYIEPGAQEVHGFSLEYLYEASGGQYFEDLFESFVEDFESADVIIGHNVNFDINFLKHELEGCGLDFKPKNTFCTMNYYKDICKLLNSRGDYKNPKLEEVIKFLGITPDVINETSHKYFEGSGNFHDARFDTSATYLIVTHGIKKGLIPSGYFSKMVGNTK